MLFLVSSFYPPLQGEFSGSGTNMAMGAVDYIVYGSVTKFGKKEKVIQTNKFSSVKDQTISGETTFSGSKAKTSGNCNS